MSREKNKKTESWEDLPDEKLTALGQSGDRRAEDILLERYKRLVRARARELFLVGGDRDDLLQEGMLGLFKAIREYRPDREASFSTFASLLITRQMYTAIQASQRQKHQPLNASLSIQELTENREEAALGLQDSPEAIVVGEESARALREQIDRALSPYERKVLDLYLDGQDYLEIAAQLQRPAKSVDNALQRIRGKVAALKNHQI